MFIKNSIICAFMHDEILLFSIHIANRSSSSYIKEVDVIKKC